jgi:DnaJ family protein C protein 19
VTFIVTVENHNTTSNNMNTITRLFQRIRSPRLANSKFIEGGFEAEMTRKEAALILSVKEGSNEEEIKSAHRKMMRINHPDNGGSTFISTKINEAKNTLLGGRRHL